MIKIKESTNDVKNKKNTMMVVSSGDSWDTNRNHCSRKGKKQTYRNSAYLELSSIFPTKLHENHHDKILKKQKKYNVTEKKYKNQDIICMIAYLMIKMSNTINGMIRLLCTIV